jgi:hypothetical protein
MNSISNDLKPAAFVSAVSREVVAYFAKAQKPVHSRSRSYLAQFWWGSDSSVHYEIWIHEHAARIELGLHFESNPTRNSSLYAAFGSYLLEIQDRLGESVWLEEWDKGWARLYETLPYAPMDEARVYAVAGRFCEIIECVQPIYETL